jgi:hypothetical protein
MFSGKKPDCIACGYVIALPENYDVIEVIDRYGHTLIDGDGSIKLSEIDFALDMCYKETSESNIYKIVLYLSTAIAKRHKELKDGQKDTARVLDKRQGNRRVQTGF